MNPAGSFSFAGKGYQQESSGAPPALVDAVYRQLAKLYHPDVGGDLRTMQQINEAYARLKQTSP